MGVLEVKGIGKRFGKNVVLNNVDVDVHEGDVLGIIGINGSGKTTLLRILIGYYKANAGSIKYRNKSLQRQYKKVKREFGFASQESSFYPKLTVKENMQYFGRLYGLSHKQIKENMQNILQLVELDDVQNVLAQHLSGGMQRRLDLACAIIHHPQVLILDEPTEDLDPLLRREIVEVIRNINKVGTTVVITSHILEDIEHVCNRVAILHDNTILKVGSVAELRRLYNKEEEIHLEIESGKYDRIIKFAKLKDVEQEGKKLVIYTNQAEKTLHTILHIIERDKEKLIYADIKKPDLTEIFEGLTTKKQVKKGK